MKILIEESVLRQALEALDNIPMEYDFHGNPLDSQFSVQVEDAITALRSALDAADKEE